MIYIFAAVVFALIGLFIYASLRTGTDEERVIDEHEHQLRYNAPPQS